MHYDELNSRAERNDHDAPRFTTPAGEIVGWRDKGVIRASGIRYVRAQRFRTPTDEPPSITPIQATEWSPASPQNTIPELNEALGVTEQEFHAVEG
ncbi:hypothetical protein V8F66_14125 [Vreelandella sp. SM1641]|uniref:Uncharacterized protein n=1 Tax=Vreelandella sp. SM1641 TaxID=3126101 RepID=A0AAU7XLG1_9GAMM